MTLEEQREQVASALERHGWPGEADWIRRWGWLRKPYRYIEVYAETDGIEMTFDPKVSINWSAIGSVDLDTAISFRDQLNEAIKDASFIRDVLEAVKTVTENQEAQE